MSLNWEEILSESAPSANVTIICSDGKIVTHKIIVATASAFLKNLMIAADDSGEDIILLLPDFYKDQVKNLFSIQSLQLGSEDYFGASTIIETSIKHESEELLEVKADPDCLEQKICIPSKWDAH